MNCRMVRRLPCQTTQLCLMVSLDRMEVGKGGVKCALDEVHDLYGFVTNAIVTMREVIEHLYNKEYKGKVIIDDTLKGDNRFLL